MAAESEVQARKRRTPTIKLLFISTFPPSIRGESMYSYNIIREISKSYAMVDLTILTHKDDTSMETAPESLSQKTRILRRLSVNPFLRNFNGIISALHVITRKYDVVHIIGPFNKSLYGGGIGEGLIPLCFLTNVFKIPLFFSVHTVYFKKDLSNKLAQKIRNNLLQHLALGYLHIVARVLMKSASHIFLVSKKQNGSRMKHVVDEYAIDSNRVSAELHPIQILPNSSQKPIELSKEEIIGQDKFVSCLGYFREEKGYHLAVQAWRLLSEIGCRTKLIIAGPANDKVSIDYLHYIDSMVSDYRLEDLVYLIPRYMREEEMSWLLDHSIFTLVPYITNMGTSGIVTLSTGRGIPTLCTQLAEIVAEFKGQCYWSVPTVDGIFKQVVSLLSKSETELRKMGTVNRSVESCKMNTFDQIAKSYLETYLRVSGTN